MSEYIANTNRTIIATSTTTWVPNVTWTNTEGNFSIDGSNVIVNQITGTASGCTYTGHTFVIKSGVVTPIASSADKTKSKNLAVMREGDQGSCTGSFTNDSSGNPATCSCTFEIDDPGQSKVKAE